MNKWILREWYVRSFFFNKNFSIYLISYFKNQFYKFIGDAIANSSLPQEKYLPAALNMENRIQEWLNNKRLSIIITEYYGQEVFNVFSTVMAKLI